jgi:acyl-CoA hydrolase
MHPQAVPAADVDLSRFIRPGDRVVLAQATAEPQTLARLLIAQRHRFPGVEVFIGPCYTDLFAAAETDGLRFVSYGALGSAGQLAASGRLDVLTMPYGRLSTAYESGEFQADVVLMQVAPALPGRRHSAGLSNDFALSAMARARAVIVEVDPYTPWTHGAELPANTTIALRVQSEHRPPETTQPPLGAIEIEIARRVAALVPDQATVQMGVGTLPNAIMAALMSHRDLGIHSGVMGDPAVDLIETGVVTNAHKGLDLGITVTNTLIGTRKLYDFAHDRKDVEVRPGTYTHSLAIMARLNRLIAINGGLEVDLGGQVNTEVAGGRYLGALGGGLEFTRGAALSPGGRAIVAMASMTANGRFSRIVPRVAIATIPRADVDTIVTEHGVAELRAVTLRERARRLIAIAAPAQRESLERAAYAMEGCRAD